MTVLKHNYNEYCITMPDDTDLDQLEDDMNKLVDSKIISDWEDSDFEGKEIHVFLRVSHDNEGGWLKVGNALDMSLEKLVTAREMVSKTYWASFENMPEEDKQLWNKPLPGAKPVEDYHNGDMITLSRMDQLREDEDNFYHLDWGDEGLLFHLDPEADQFLVEKIEKLLLQTEEV